MSAFYPSLAEGERSIFCGFHDFTFARSFIVDAHEVEHAMNEHTVEFVVIVFTQHLGIGAHGIEGDVEVACQHCSCTIIKGDDVGVVVVLEILPISGEYLFVIAEDIVDFSQSAIVLRSDTAQPGFFGAHV